MIDIRIDQTEWSVEEIINKNIIREAIEESDAFWSEAQQSLLAESLLLQIPALPIYVTVVEHNEDRTPIFATVGQRSKSYVKALRNIKNCLRFVDLVQLPKMNGRTFFELTRPIQRSLKETRIPVRIVDKGICYACELIKQEII